MSSHSFIRGTTLGDSLRLISRRKILQYPEEKNITIYASFIVEDEESDRVELEQGIDMREREPRDLETERNTTEPLENGFANNRVRKKNDYKRIVVGWYGQDDPENPTNWSSYTKLFVTGQLCFLNFAVYMGSSIYTSGELGVMNQFHVSETVATLGLTLYVIGYGCGPMLFSPMSDIPRIGRNPTYIWTLAIFVVLQIPVALARDISMLMVFRFITGFFSSPILATGGASISDMYVPSKRAYGIAIWGALGVCGPVLGPLIGGFAAQSLGWKWTIWSLMIITGFTLIMLVAFLPETNASCILYNRALRLRALSGNHNIRSQAEAEGSEMSLMRSIHFSVVQGFSLAFLEPIVLFINLYTALVYGLLYVWFESFDIVFRGIYEFPPEHEGLSFLGILVGGFIIVPLYLWYYRVKVEAHFFHNDHIKPEIFIPPACVGGFAVTICLFWFGWSSRVSIPWIVPIIGSSFFTVGVVLLFNPALTYLGATYPDYAAAVFGGNAFARATFGAAFPLFSRAMYHKLDVGGASSLLGGLSVLFIPIPFVLYFYGERIRKRSKRASHA